MREAHTFTARDALDILQCVASLSFSALREDPQLGSSIQGVLSAPHSSRPRMLLALKDELKARCHTNPHFLMLEHLFFEVGGIHLRDEVQEDMHRMLQELVDRVPTPRAQDKDPEKALLSLLERARDCGWLPATPKTTRGKKRTDNPLPDLVRAFLQALRDHGVSFDTLAGEARAQGWACSGGAVIRHWADGTRPGPSDTSKLYVWLRKRARNFVNSQGSKAEKELVIFLGKHEKALQPAEASWKT